MRVETCQDEYRLAVRSAAEIAIHGHQAPIAGTNRLAVYGDDLPVEHRALGQPVGDEQGLRGGSDAEIGELRQKQKGQLAQGHLGANSTSS